MRTRTHKPSTGRKRGGGGLGTSRFACMANAVTCFLSMKGAATACAAAQFLCWNQVSSAPPSQPQSDDDPSAVQVCDQSSVAQADGFPRDEMQRSHGGKESECFRDFASSSRKDGPCMGSEGFQHPRCTHHERHPGENTEAEVGPMESANDAEVHGPLLHELIRKASSRRGHATEVTRVCDALYSAPWNQVRPCEPEVSASWARVCQAREFTLWGWAP